MKQHLPLLSVALFACAPPFTPLALEATSQTLLTGNGRDDLWAYRKKKEAPADGQWDLMVTTLQHFDGKGFSAVPFPSEVFAEGLCGSAEHFIPGAKGELWLSAEHVPHCGQPGNAAYRKVLFGLVKADGSFTDFSADFPEQPVETYHEVKLQHLDDGVLVSVDGALFRYTAAGRQTAGVPTAFDDTKSPGDEPGQHLVFRNAGETWRLGPWNSQGTGEHLSHLVDGAWKDVTFDVKHDDKQGRVTEPPALFPRGGGKVTLFARTGYRTPEYSNEYQFIVRQLDGTKLSETATAVSGSWQCVGTDTCDYDSMSYQPLRDGAVVLQEANTFKYFLLTPDALPQ